MQDNNLVESINITDIPEKPAGEESFTCELEINQDDKLTISAWSNSNPENKIVPKERLANNLLS